MGSRYCGIALFCPGLGRRLPEGRRRLGPAPPRPLSLPALRAPRAGQSVVAQVASFPFQGAATFRRTARSQRGARGGDLRRGRRGQPATRFAQPRDSPVSRPPRVAPWNFVRGAAAVSRSSSRNGSSKRRGKPAATGSIATPSRGGDPVEARSGCRRHSRAGKRNVLPVAGPAGTWACPGLFAGGRFSSIQVLLDPRTSTTRREIRKDDSSLLCCSLRERRSEGAEPRGGGEADPFLSAEAQAGPRLKLGGEAVANTAAVTVTVTTSCGEAAR